MFKTRALPHSASVEQGQTLIFVAVVFFVLLGLGAMAVDVGGILWSRGAEQNAADAAALAGVRALPDATAAQTIVTTYAENNGFKVGVDGVTAIDTNVYTEVNGMPALEVTIRRDVSPWLRSAVNSVGNINVPARAVAVASSAQACDVWPWALVYDPENDITEQYGVEQALRVSSGSKVAAGSFGIIRLNSTDTKNDYLPHIINRGCMTDNIPRTEGGVDTGATRTGVKTVITNAVGTPDQWPQYTPANSSLWTWVTGWGAPDGNAGYLPDNVYWHIDTVPWGLGNPISVPSQYVCSGTWSTDAPQDGLVQVGTCPRVGLIPVVDGYPGGGGGKPLNVVKWAAFYLISGTDGGGQGQASVVGSFLRQVDPPKGPATYTEPTNPDLTVYVLWK